MLNGNVTVNWCCIFLQVIKYRTLADLVQQAQCSNKLMLKPSVVCISFIVVDLSQSSFNENR